MPLDQAGVVICVVLLLVLIFNAGILIALRSGLSKEWKSLTRSYHQAWNSWKHEDQALAELRQKVMQLSLESSKDPDDDEAE